MIMCEKIISIVEDTFKIGSNNWGDNYDGWTITTDQQTICVGISNDQSCCENWGYVSSLDNPEDFVGADLLEIKLVNEKLETVELPNMYEGSCMFVTFETSKGTFQLVTYNDHNGYYGHSAVVVSTQLTHSETL